MRVLVATDAWHPQINGVVRTLSAVRDAAAAMGVEIAFLTPAEFPTVPMPGYPEIALAIPRAGEVARRIGEAAPDAIHIATEGPVGWFVRRHCLAHRRPFTTSFHTRLPDYIAARVPLPEEWTWRWLRGFHNAGSGVMVSTPALAAELAARGFANIHLWLRGVDTALFRPQAGATLGLPRPIFLNVGRLAVEKNLEAFLALDLPGTKVVVGDGPARAALQAKFPSAVFLGMQEGAALARIYAAADAFVFPSRTDTYGLVLLEALASGLPVAAFPVPGPVDVIGRARVGVLAEDLRSAALLALNVPREACRAFALRHGWRESARQFLANIEAAGACREPATGRCVTSAKEQPSFAA
ncbi:MAG: glycosyltransferase family 1 protein [Bradyrhizobiaceae bacterium]|nr:glycosyltransferase family 1 protein [Bradyrhizobiaceae bacterium]